MPPKSKNKKIPKECPIELVLKLIGTKWKLLIIRDLLEGKKRFGELKKSTGATQKMLSLNLKEMEENNLIERKAYSEVPPRVEYSLTDVGLSLGTILDAMADWGDAYQEYCELKKKLKQE